MLQQIKIVLILNTIIAVSACNYIPKPYKIDIPQGNKFLQSDVSKLKTGMTERQVQYILGSPIIQDKFHPNRWDYIYSMKPGKGKLQKRHLTLHFKAGLLERIESGS